MHDPDPAVREHKRFHSAVGRATKKRAERAETTDIEQIERDVVNEFNRLLEILEDKTESSENIKLRTNILMALDRALERRANLMGRGDIKITVVPTEWETGVMDRQFEIWAKERGFVKS